MNRWRVTVEPFAGVGFRIAAPRARSQVKSKHVAPPSPHCRLGYRRRLQGRAPGEKRGEICTTREEASKMFLGRAIALGSPLQANMGNIAARLGRSTTTPQSDRRSSSGASPRMWLGGQPTGRHAARGRRRRRPRRRTPSSASRSSNATASSRSRRSPKTAARCANSSRAPAPSTARRRATPGRAVSSSDDPRALHVCTSLRAAATRSALEAARLRPARRR